MKLCKNCTALKDGQCSIYKKALELSKTNDYKQADSCKGRRLPKKDKKANLSLTKTLRKDKIILEKTPTISKKIPTDKRISKLKKELDTLWSKCVRARDKKCVMCGNTNGLAAHHWILTRAQGNATRWELSNGATLCYACHIHKVHSHPDVDTLNQLRQGMRFISDEEIDRIISLRNKDKQTEDELLEIKKNFLDYLKQSGII